MTGSNDTDGETNLPPVPPSDTFRIPPRHTEQPAGEQRVESRVSTCGCGGQIDEFVEFSGRVVVETWPDEFAGEFETTNERAERRQFTRCQQCGHEVYF